MPNLTCAKCGHVWTPKLKPPALPQECPACKSRNWNEAKK